VDVIRTVAIVGVILLHAANDLIIQQMNSFEIFVGPPWMFTKALGEWEFHYLYLLSGALLLQPFKK